MTPFQVNEYIRLILRTPGTVLPKISDAPVLRVTSDSREVVPGTLFVAVQGGAQDGHDFLEGAEKKGAVLLVGEQEPSGLFAVPYLQVKDSRFALAQAASLFYGDPSSQLLVIGVTGTSGKTTTTYILEAILKEAGHKVGVIGTIQIRMGEKILPSSLTTPDAVALQHILFRMKSEGCTAVVMEVSSHALQQRRAHSVAFDGMLFTNLSPEHLDFHKDMEDYYHTKALLFTDLAFYASERGKKPVGVVNEGDVYGKRLFNQLGQLEQHPSPFLTLRGFQPDTNRLRVTLEGIRGDLQGVSVCSKLTGEFNVSNLVGAITLAQAMGIPNAAIERGLAALPGVPGRLERVENPKGLYIWVDYAHKADALEKVIHSLRQIPARKRLITVFGCGGDRDRQKRPLMGRIAVEGSDHVFITSDNPRTENPESIIQEILAGIQGFTNFTVEVDRRKAIYQAVQFAQTGDLILIAGKGHEDYQILGTKKIHFDDREVVADAFKETMHGKLDTSF